MEKVEKVADALKKATIGGEEKESKKPKKEKKEKKMAADDGASSGPIELQPPPSFLQDRIELFDKLKKKHDEEIAKKPREEILITMPDGSVKTGKAWETTPGEIAKGISNSLYKKAVVAKLNGDPEQLWDLDRPLESSCKLELLTFEHPEGKKVFWHSSAHILGEACERRFGCSM
jgi:threonyl-tRNA synthetase